MDLLTCIAEVVQADELFEDDMILVGDLGVGVAIFTTVRAIEDDGNVLRVHVYNRIITVKHDTEVIRLEQGVNTFADGAGRFRTRRPVHVHAASPQGQDAA